MRPVLSSGHLLSLLPWSVRFGKLPSAGIVVQRYGLLPAVDTEFQVAAVQGPYLQRPVRRHHTLCGVHGSERTRSKPVQDNSAPRVDIQSEQQAPARPADLLRFEIYRQLSALSGSKKVMLQAHACHGRPSIRGPSSTHASTPPLYGLSATTNSLS